LEVPHAAQRLLPSLGYRQRSREDPRLGAGGGRSRLRLYRGVRSRWSVRHSSPFADVRRSLPDRCRFIYARHRSCNIPV
jgi:hypothetical protein